MTQEEIIEGNRLIAKFKGWFEEENGLEGTWYEIQGHAKYVAFSTYKETYRDLPFHRSWDWLIPVVEKIDQLEIVYYFSILFNHSSDILLTNVKISDYDNNFYQHIKGDENTIDIVYKTTVEFIKWYNLKTK